MIRLTNTYKYSSQSGYISILHETQTLVFFKKFKNHFNDNCQKITQCKYSIIVVTTFFFVHMYAIQWFTTKMLLCSLFLTLSYQCKHFSSLVIQLNSFRKINFNVIPYLDCRSSNQIGILIVDFHRECSASKIHTQNISWFFSFTHLTQKTTYILIPCPLFIQSSQITGKQNNCTSSTINKNV